MEYNPLQQGPSARDQKTLACLFTMQLLFSNIEQFKYPQSPKASKGRTKAATKAPAAKATKAARTTRGATK